MSEHDAQAPLPGGDVTEERTVVDQTQEVLAPEGHDDERIDTRGDGASLKIDRHP